MSEIKEYYDGLNQEQLKFELMWNHEELAGLARQIAELNREWAVLQEHQSYIAKRLGEFATSSVPDVSGRDL